MKLNFEFKPILVEGISNIVYHFSDMNNIKSIITSDTFKLSSTLAKSSEGEINKKYFYLSTTRSRVGSYHYSHGMKQSLRSHVAMFKLDGRALSAVVGGTAVDYWGRDFRLAEPTKNEMEDRIVTDKPEIKNASKYILSLECYYNKDDTRKTDHLNPLRDVIRIAIEHNITVNLYLNQQDFITGRRALQNDAALEVVNDHGPELEKIDRSGRQSFLAPFIELMTTKDEASLSKKASDILYALGYDYNFNSELKKLQNDFHNENRHDDSRKLTVLAKQAGAKSLRELLIYIRDKFKTVQ